jgi:hypothetical protein
MMNEEELRLAYKSIPKPILDEIIPHLPVTGRDEHGNALYLDAFADRDIRRYCRMKLTPPGAAKVRSDGPDPPEKFWVGGEGYGPFTPGEMRLLTFLWKKRSVDVRMALKAVYGTEEVTERRQFPEQALEKMVKRVRGKLALAPVAIRKNETRYYLEVFKTP